MQCKDSVQTFDPVSADSAATIFGACQTSFRNSVTERSLPHTHLPAAASTRPAERWVLRCYRSHVGWARHVAQATRDLFCRAFIARHGRLVVAAAVKRPVRPTQPAECERAVKHVVDVYSRPSCTGTPLTAARRECSAASACLGLRMRSVGRS